MKSKLNLTVLLKHLDLRNLELYAAFQHDEINRKELERMLSFLLPLWVSGTINGTDQIKLTIAFNKHVNEGWRESEAHPELRAKVLASIGLGQVIRHDYHFRERRKATPLREFLTQSYPDIRDDEVYLWCSINSESTLLNLCRNYGIQEYEREAIINAYRNLVT